MTYICIPPSRRNGPRESVKENIADAETRYLLGLLSSRVESTTQKLIDADAAIDAAVRTQTDTLTELGDNTNRL